MSTPAAPALVDLATQVLHLLADASADDVAAMLDALALAYVALAQAHPPLLTAAHDSLASAVTALAHTQALHAQGGRLQ